MTENQPTAITPAAEVPAPDKKPSVLVRVRTKYPRAFHAAKLTAAGAALVLGTRAVTNAQHNKERLAEGMDHAKEAGDAFTDAVVNTDEA